MQKYCLCNYFCNVNSCFALCGLSIPGKLLWWGPLSRGDLAARSTPLSQDPLAIQLLKPHISPHRQVCRQEKLRSGRDTSQPASPISFFQGFRADPTGKKKKCNCNYDCLGPSLHSDISNSRDTALELRTEPNSTALLASDASTQSSPGHLVMFPTEQCPHTISCPLNSSRAQCFFAVLLSTSLDKREQISSGSAPTSFLWLTLHIQKCQAVNSRSCFFLSQCKNGPVTHILLPSHSCQISLTVLLPEQVLSL